MPALPHAKDYDALYRQFRWNIPARYNIGVDCCDKWADAEPGRLAILHVHPDGSEDAVSFWQLREMSNRLANVLRAHNINRADRVAIMLPQMPEVAAAHFAIYKLGAVALPIAILFGPDALSYRLQNSGAKALLTNTQGRRQAQSDSRRGAGTVLRALVRRPRRRRRQPQRHAGARLIRFHARRYGGRRSGADDLHLRHHRPAQGRAARASRAARARARRGNAALRISAGGRPLLDAGRLGLGRRSA